MNRRINYFNRLVVLASGLLILAGGAWAVGLYLDLPPAQRLTDFIDFPAWRAAPGQPWFDWLLAGVLLVSAVLGGWLIALNLRRYRVSRVTSPASGTAGTIELNLATLAGAIARELEEHPRVDSVLHSVTRYWDRPTMTITVRAGRGGHPRPARHSRTGRAGVPRRHPGYHRHHGVPAAPPAAPSVIL